MLSCGAYACLLLAELLDRAEGLETARALDRAEAIEAARGLDSANALEAACPLARAVDLFLLDVAEARARGLRARLFSRDKSGTLDPWSVDPTDMLEDLGGEIVPIEALESAINESTGEEPEAQGAPEATAVNESTGEKPEAQETAEAIDNGS